MVARGGIVQYVDGARERGLNVQKREFAMRSGVTFVRRKKFRSGSFTLGKPAKVPINDSKSTWSCSETWCMGAKRGVPNPTDALEDLLAGDIL